MKAQMIMLHGVGASGRDLVSLANVVRDAVPFLSVHTPDAPFAFDLGPMGRQWFSIAGVTSANRGKRVEEARAAFNALIDALPIDQPLILFGFSQGAIMALDALASGRHRPHLTIAVAGRLALSPAPSEWHGEALLIHGRHDEVIPVSVGEAAARALAAAGHLVRFEEVPGGHGIGIEALRQTVACVSEVLERT